MQIEVRYFASLRERVGCEQELIELQSDATVAQAWETGSAGFSLPGNALCAINEEYAALEDRVTDGDQVAFFPPVTGG
ncbi:MAG: molybdopterin synthase sulfur carrier subunit [Gammaproteobacteria bacterium]|nr:MAG: molybdopterin synthase sulfur carrier subunit [Gammaproteobacteria bacterium]